MALWFRAAPLDEGRHDQSRQPQACQNPQADGRTQLPGELPFQDEPPLVPRHVSGVLCGVLEGPEPELVKDARPPEDEAREGEGGKGPGRQEAHPGGGDSPPDGPTPHRRPQQVQTRQHRESGARLFHQDGHAQAQAAPEEHQVPALFEAAQEEHEAAQRRQDDEMGGMPSQAQHRRADGEQGVGGGRRRAGPGAGQPPGQQEHQDDCPGVDDRQAHVDARGRLAEDDHDRRVSGIDARELHVVRQLVRRHAFEQELAGIGVLALVAFQGQVQEAHADGHGRHDDHQDQGPGQQPLDEARHGRGGALAALVALAISGLVLTQQVLSVAGGACLPAALKLCNREIKEVTTVR